MTRLERRTPVLVYGASGASKALIDASMVIWNLVGLAALGAIAVWLAPRVRDLGLFGRTGTLGERLFATPSGKAFVPAPRAEQRGRANFVTGNTTNEDILAHELEAYQAQEPKEARAGKTAPTLPPTSEDILAKQLEEAKSTTRKPGGEGK